MSADGEQTYKRKAEAQRKLFTQATDVDISKEYLLI